MDFLISQRHGGMSFMSGIVGMERPSSSGRTDRGDEEGVLYSTSVTSWSEQSSALEWIRRWLRAYGSVLKGGQGQVTSQWGSSTGHLTRKTRWTRPSIDRWEQPHIHKSGSSWGTSATLVSVGKRAQQDTSNPGSSWNALMHWKGESLLHRM